MGGRTHPHGAPFGHELLLYDGGDGGFVQAALAHVARALADDVRVLVAVTPARASALSEALGEQAARVRFADARALARNPARMIPAWRELRDEQAAGARRALAIGEPVWPGRSKAELEECEREEALVNVAFAEERDWRMLCAYDLDGLDDSVIEAARARHPLLAADGGGVANAAYAGACEPLLPFAGSLPAPRGGVTELAFAGGDLAQLRRAVFAWASGEGLDRDGSDDLVLAVDELAANSIRHGGGSGTLRCWREGRRLLCEVCDAGTMHDPLLGRRRPPPEASSGRGVWLVNQLCDLVQIRSAPGRTVVRVHKRLP